MWNPVVRTVTIWNKEQMRDVTYNNIVHGECIKGLCKAGGDLYGTWGQRTSFRSQIWYYIAESNDGGAVAYVTGSGPRYGGKEVSYAEAGKILYDFYEDLGIDDDNRRKQLDKRYQGGFEAFLKDTQSLSTKSTQVVNGNVKEASCNPQLDDDCTVNGKAVSKADLGKYLPTVDRNIVEDDGGYCEYPICYNADDRPIGITAP
tara:strand:- start:10332 stop:10940 length:609 start_codon:yes stop_codon:yes gene_type:complete